MMNPPEIFICSFSGRVMMFHGGCIRRVEAEYRYQALDEESGFSCRILQ